MKDIIETIKRGEDCPVMGEPSFEVLKTMCCYWRHIEAIQLSPTPQELLKFMMTHGLSKECNDIIPYLEASRLDLEVVYRILKIVQREYPNLKSYEKAPNLIEFISPVKKEIGLMALESVMNGTEYEKIQGYWVLRLIFSTWEP